MDQTGDLEERIAARARDLHAPSTYLDIAGLCLDAGDPARAVDWAERAVRDFPHASDLAGFAREFGFSLGGAAHPEMHPSSSDWTGDLAGACHKVSAGCEFLITA